MGNIYGVANPQPIAAAYGTASSADVTLTAGSEITVITTGAIVAPSPGFWYPMIWLSWTVVLGATASTALVFAFKLGSGADVDTFTIEPGLLQNNAELQSCVVLVGVASATAWVGSGSTINITGKATAQNATFKGVGSRAVVRLIRGPDA